MNIEVIRDLTQPMRHIVHVRNHLLAADGSVEEGGNDSGPSPHDLYDTALGSCKALTLVWYARRKNIALTDVRVSVARDSSDERRGTYRLTATVYLEGDLTEVQRAELLAIADKCPVHKLMTTVETEITTVLG